jgi:hypothetical protein
MGNNAAWLFPEHLLQALLVGNSKLVAAIIPAASQYFTTVLVGHT